MIETFYINIMTGKIYAKVKGRKKGSLVYTSASGDFIKLNGKHYYLNEKEQKQLNNFLKKLDEEIEKN